MRKITYSDEPPRFTGIDLNSGEGFSQISEPLFHKGTEWAYEREWRVLRHLNTADDVKPSEPHAIHLMRFPLYALEEIIFGAKAGGELQADVSKKARRPVMTHVTAYEAEFSRKRRKMNRRVVSSADLWKAAKLPRRV